MKTTSRTKVTRLKAVRTLAVVVLLCVAFGVVALTRDALASIAWRVLGPITAARNALDTGEVGQLQAQLLAAQARLADRDLLAQENLELKVRLGRSAGVSTVLAGVLLRPPGIPYDTLLIDAGAEEGIREGDLVSAGGTALVGRVREVYANTARVVLFSAPSEVHAGLLLRGAGGEVVPIELKGQGGGALAGIAPAGTLAAVGDRVVLPGIAGGLSAIVSAVEDTEGGSFETLHLRLPANPFALRYVEVWRSSNL